MRFVASIIKVQNLRKVYRVGKEKAVSYTHLDVYKRQGSARRAHDNRFAQRKANDGGVGINARLFGDDGGGVADRIPVSYTHLDVYKRQI